jgi:hypothetical protein
MTLGVTMLLETYSSVVSPSVGLVGIRAARTSLFTLAIFKGVVF